MPSSSPRSPRPVSPSPRGRLSSGSSVLAWRSSAPGASRLFIGLAAGTLAIWMLRQPWAKAQFWPWLLLLLAMFYTASILRTAEPVMTRSSPKTSDGSQPVGKRRLGGIICVLFSLLLVGVVVISVAPDVNQWQGTPVIWVMAIALAVIGSFFSAGLENLLPAPSTAVSPWSDITLHRWLEILAFILILAIAFFLRIYRLSQFRPASMWMKRMPAWTRCMSLKGAPPRRSEPAGMARPTATSTTWR